MKKLQLFLIVFLLFYNLTFGIERQISFEPYPTVSVSKQSYSPSTIFKTQDNSISWSELSMYMGFSALVLFLFSTIIVETNPFVSLFLGFLSAVSALTSSVFGFLGIKTSQERETVLATWGLVYSRIVIILITAIYLLN